MIERIGSKDVIRTLLIILCLLVLLISACSNTSNEEFNIKIHPDYSDKFSSQFAIKLLAFMSLAHEYNKIAYKDGDFNEKEEVIAENLNNIHSDISNNLETFTPDELAAFEDMLSYILNVHVTTIFKAEHQLAKINNEIGITEKDRYLDIQEDLKTMKEHTDETFDKLKKYVTAK